MEHQEMGPFHYEGVGFKLSETPFHITKPSPLLGEHNEYACKKFLRMTGDEYQGLKQKGVFQ